MGIIKTDLYNADLNTVAQNFALLSHPGRLLIVQLLVTNETLSLGEIQEKLGLSQSATSEQVRKLREAGLIDGCQVETSMRYKLNTMMLTEMIHTIQNFGNGMIL